MYVAYTTVVTNFNFNGHFLTIFPQWVGLSGRRLSGMVLISAIFTSDYIL